MSQVASGQVWLVTGAGSGFGLAIVKAALERGGRVVAAARSLDRPSLMVLREMGGDRLSLVQLDVTQPDEVQSGVDHAVSLFGGVDVVVNNAGRGSFGSSEETPDSEVRNLFEVNFFGSLNVIRAVLPVLRRQRRGHVVQISSLAGVAPPAPGLASYAASKFAVEGFAEVLAKEVAHLGIGVTIVEPGDFRTGFGSALQVTPPTLSDYAASVGRAAQAFAQMDPAALGDPDRAAVAIVDAVTSGDAPLRLAFGDDAIIGIERKLKDHLAQLQAWAPTGRAMS